MAAEVRHDISRAEERPLPPLPSSPSGSSNVTPDDFQSPSSEPSGSNRDATDGGIGNSTGVTEDNSVQEPARSKKLMDPSSSTRSLTPTSTASTSVRATTVNSVWSPLIDENYLSHRPEAPGVEYSSGMASVHSTASPINREHPTTQDNSFSDVSPPPARDPTSKSSIRPVPNRQTSGLVTGSASSMTASPQLHESSRRRATSMSAEIVNMSPSSDGSTNPNPMDSSANSSALFQTPSRTRQYQRQPLHPGETEVFVPRWQPDAEVTICPICGTQFSFFVRKHHCRKCGRVVCHSCSPHRIVIPYPYIVRPVLELESLGLIPRSHTRPDQSRTSSFAEVDGLGGGERVRLCNPCVPDPNIAPPQLLPAFDQSSPTGQSYHSRSVSTPYRPPSSPNQNPAQTQATLEERLPNYPRRPRQPSNPGNRSGRVASYQGQQTPLQSSEGLPNRSRSSTLGNYQYPGQMGSQQSNMSGNSNNSGLPPNQRNNRSLIPRDLDNFSRPLPPRPSQQAPYRIPEEDECPICHQELPSRALSEFERLREDHIESCISTFMNSPSSAPHPHSGTLNSRPPNHSHQSSSGHQTPISNPNSNIPNTAAARTAAREQAHAAVVYAAQRPNPAQMRRTGVLSYTATEKDCVDDAECTICLEEFEVGVQMGRLECLCKFHLRCIRQWFEARPGQCPVHQHAY